MFENLDDPIAQVPAPLDDVVKRGRHIRARRRAILVAAPMLALVAAISAAAALQRPSAKRISVSGAPTSTTVRQRVTAGTRPATTVPSTTSTSTTSTTPTTVAVPVTAPHDPHDYSMLNVDYGGDMLSIDAGVTAVVSYTVTNAGSWSVEWTTPSCPLSLWTSGVDRELWQPFSTVWPQPVASHASLCVSGGGTVERLAAGEIRVVNQAVVAGTLDAKGNVLPTPPGWTSFQAPFMPQCVQPCDDKAPNSRSVIVYPLGWPATSIYRLAVPDTELDASSGGTALVRVAYTNPLAFTVRLPIYGPCWRVESGAGHVDCSGPIPTVTVAPNSTTGLVGTVFARAGFAAGGKPLAAGRYELTIADRLPSVAPSKGVGKTVFLNVS